MGPMLVGLEKSVQIAPLGAKMSEISQRRQWLRPTTSTDDAANSTLNADDFARTSAFMAPHLG